MFHKLLHHALTSGVQHTRDRIPAEPRTGYACTINRHSVLHLYTDWNAHFHAHLRDAAVVATVKVDIETIFVASEKPLPELHFGKVRSDDKREPKLPLDGSVGPSRRGT